VNNTDGSIVGYKYFNFDETSQRDDVTLLMRLTPQGIDGTLTIMIDRPWISKGGKVLGNISLKADMPKVPTELTVSLPDLKDVKGKHALYFLFSSDTKARSLCTLHDFVFM
jgi:hypothetical protein